MMDPPEAEPNDDGINDNLRRLKQVLASGATLLSAPLDLDNSDYFYDDGRVADYDEDDNYDGDDTMSSMSKEPPTSVWNSPPRPGYLDDPPRSGYSDDPRSGYSDDPRLGYSDDPEEGGRVANYDGGGGLGFGGGGNSVGRVGTRSADRFRRAVPAVCLLLAVAFGCRIVYINFIGKGSSGGITVEGNEASDSNEAGRGWSDGYDYFDADEEMMNGEAAGGFDSSVDNDDQGEKEEETEGVMEETFVDAVVGEEPKAPIPSLAPTRKTEGVMEETFVDAVVEEPKAPIPSMAPTRNEALDWWCGTCNWKNVTNCDSRVQWEMNKYHISKVEAMESAREFCMKPTRAPSGITEAPTPNPDLHWWCGTCSWKNFTSCDNRLNYVMHKYHISELEAMNGIGREYCGMPTQSPMPSPMPSPSPSISMMPSPMPSPSPSISMMPSPMPSPSPSISMSPSSDPTSKPMTTSTPTSSLPTAKP
jgi:hypothetical protein